jgi:hypothetical protein
MALGQALPQELQIFRASDISSVPQETDPSLFVLLLDGTSEHAMWSALTPADVYKQQQIFSLHASIYIYRSVGTTNIQRIILPHPGGYLWVLTSFHLSAIIKCACSEVWCVCCVWCVWCAVRL